MSGSSLLENCVHIGIKIAMVAVAHFVLQQNVTMDLIVNYLILALVPIVLEGGVETLKRIRYIASM